MYDKAILFENLPQPFYIGRGHALFGLERYSEAYDTYLQAATFQTHKTEVHLRLGDILTIFNKPDEAAEEYKKCLRLAAEETDPDKLWFLASTLKCSYRPADVQLELFYYFLEVGGADPYLHQIFSHLGTLYEQLFDTHRDSGGVCFKSIEMLHKMLVCLSEDKREDALTLIGQSKNRYIAQLLILLRPFALPGLTRLARNIATEWEYTTQDDELAIPFFSVLDGYKVAPSDRDLFLARYYMAKGFYAWAEPLLSQLIQEQVNPESIWLKAQALRGLQQSPHEQVQLLESFIALLPTDKRVAQAYLAIGDLYGEYLEDGLKAVEAYKEAERRGLFVPQLQAFRQGKWDVIPALTKHAYFAYPPIVVIDLECDYQPDGPTRSSIFEVGAVRIKGDFIIDEYEAIIQTEPIAEKFRHRRWEAKTLEQVTQELLKFIEQSTLDEEAPAIVAGHNLRLFDAEYLDIMGIELNDAQIVDTLEFARLLYPESLHHHLELLCHAHEISFEGNAHEALPDARACAHLSYALGEELLKRGEHLLAGFRAFVSPGSAFDRAILQPRGIRLDPTHPWELDPTPTSPHILGSIEGAPASSPHILAAFASKRDALIESDDRYAAYVQHMSGDQRTVVVVNTRTRLERILTMSRQRNDHFVLPDFRTLLCPHLLRQHIEQAESQQIKLELFCLYQASHNHDARTLYPLRISSNKTALTDKAPLTNLRELLLASCCASDWSHAASCEAVSATEAAIDQHTLLLATHECFLALPSIYQPRAETIIIDEIDKLQLHFAEYLADQLTNQQLQSWSTEIFQLLHAQITAFSQEYAGRQGFRERHHMRNIVPYLITSENDEKKSLLVRLKEAGPIGKHVAQKLQIFCDAAMRERGNKEAVHAYWLDLEFEQETRRNIEQWRFCGLSRPLPEAFHESFWAPYKHHIICGTAITLGNLKTKFLQRFFGLPEEIDFYKDENASSSRSRVYVPPLDVLRPASFLARRSWAESIGNFLYSFALSQQRSFVVSLNETTIAHALANALNEESRQKRLPYQILSPHLKWTTAKIAKRLARSGKQTITILSPHARKTMLDDNIDIEVTGPIRFLNQRDPLVAAQMQVFAQKYKDEGPVSAYLLPQALLELKSRLSTQAKLHIILDSSLRAKVYQDEVFSLFNEREIVNTLPGVLEALRYPSQSFLDCLRLELDGQGISNHTDISEKDLYLTLQTVWGEKTFREEPDQKKIVQDVLAGKDQLVIAATGGGKSLCFQLPAILMAQDVVPKVTLIFSPLIALMEDQVNMLRSKGVFTAIRWNSTLSEAERQDYQRGIKQGDYSIIYIAPEQIHTSKLRKALETREVGLIAFDEAHCVSQWGHDFRTDYFAVKNWINTQICAVEGQRNFPLLALTATARKGYRNPDNGYSESSTIQDIIHNLGLRKSLSTPLTEDDVTINSPERKELQFYVEPITFSCSQCELSARMQEEKVFFSCDKDCREKIKKAKMAKLKALLTDMGQGGLGKLWSDHNPIKRYRGIIYCCTTSTVDEVAEDLQDIPGIHVGHYHAQMQNAKVEREKTYQRFITHSKDDSLDIIVATNAFGMGIDVRHLAFVIHFDIPATPEAYYQEAGRAGRDASFKSGEDYAQCILFYHKSDLQGQRSLRAQNTFTEQQVEAVYELLCRLRRSDQKELLITRQVIEMMTGVNEKLVDTILYYLEYHSTIHGVPPLKRGEWVSYLWHLKLEAGYQQKAAELTGLSEQLLKCFYAPGEYGLREEKFSSIDARSLASSVKQEIKVLEPAIAKLAMNGIISYESPGQIRLTKEVFDAQLLLDDLKTDMLRLFKNIDADGLLQKRDFSLYLNTQVRKLELCTVPLSTLANFLFQLSHISVDAQKLLESFKLEVRKGQSHCYLCKMRPMPINSTHAWLNKFFTALSDTLKKLYNWGINDQWQLLALSAYIPQYQERQAFHQRLLCLMLLGIIAYQPEPSLNGAMHITFTHGPTSTDLLKVDLSSLRRQEKYEEEKLNLMQMYAEEKEYEQRHSLLMGYFEGKDPLVKPFTIDPRFIDQQREIVILTDGYHLIEGPAGCGKTSTLREHIRYLVDCQFVPADRILITSHSRGTSNRFSEEYKNLAIKSTTLDSLAETIFRQYFHLLQTSIGTRYFAEDTIPKRIKGGWQEIENEEFHLVRETLACMEQGIRPLETRQQEVLQFPDEYEREPNKIAKKCLKVIHILKEYGIFPTHARLPEVFQIISKCTKGADINFYYEVYCHYLLFVSKRGLYTYEDSILFALAILKTHPDICKQQSRYEHIIIDEFQDLTYAQSELVGLLSTRHQTLLVFGDNAQDIRVTQNDSIPLGERLAWLKHKQLTQHTLTTNFRSMQEILDLAAAIYPYQDHQRQTAIWGQRGIKPTFICVNMPPPVSADNNGEDISDAFLHTLVNISLQQKESLPPADREQVAFVVAKSSWVYRVSKYLQDIPHSILGSHRYSSRHIGPFINYLRLVKDNQDDKVARWLLDSFIVNNKQLRKLQTLAQSNQYRLIDAILEQEILKQLKISQQQELTLFDEHPLLHNFNANSSLSEVYEAIKNVQNGFLPHVEDNERIEELEKITTEFKQLTVEQAIHKIDSHIAFFDERKGETDLIITSVDHAKSNAFDTVFLLGANWLFDRKRWYVTISRAKRRFFFLAINERKTSNVLSDILKEKELYDEQLWA